MSPSDKSDTQVTVKVCEPLLKYTVNFATKACILQNVLLNLIFFNITLEKLNEGVVINKSVILLHVF